MTPARRNRPMNKMTESERRVRQADARLARTQIELERARLAACAALMGIDLTPAVTGPRAAWQALVDQKVAAGLSRVQAIQEAARENPALYDQQRVLKIETPAETPTTSARDNWEAAIAAKVADG